MELYTLTEIAYMMDMTRQAVFVAIKKGKLKAKKIGPHWYMTLQNLRDYLDSKYVRPNRCKPGEVTVEEACRLLGLGRQRLYYLIYRDRFTYEKRDGMIFLQRKSLMC
jgi:hypothetical protein